MSYHAKKRIIFNKYRIEKLICKTHFSELYEGININDKELVAIKMEQKKTNIFY